MSLKYLSVCSGIEAASVAWTPLGFQAVAFAEIEAFPSAVLAHHYPDVPNRGDLTQFQEWPDAAFDVLVGGTPCQSFSVAGLRAGLADPRGNLTLTYLAVLDRYRPRWCCWENVPGVLSADDGRALGAFLGGLAELGYRFAYRVLDAQYFGLAQRRARVFVVGHLGDWHRAAAVLFERESLSGHPAPGREAGEDITGTLSSRASAGGGLGTDFDLGGGLIAPTAPTIGQRMRGPIDSMFDGALIPSTGDISHCLNAGGMGRIDYETETLIAHSLRADGFDASEDGTGRGTPRQGYPAVAFDARQSDVIQYGEKSGPLDTDGHTIAIAQPLLAKSNSSHDDSKETYVRAGMQVRRLTPRECERLQGFPDDYTLIPYRGKLAADGPRYKALGNSMAVPCMRWIGERIKAVDELSAGIRSEEAR